MNAEWEFRQDEQDAAISCVSSGRFYAQASLHEQNRALCTQLSMGERAGCCPLAVALGEAVGMFVSSSRGTEGEPAWAGRRYLHQFCPLVHAFVNTVTTGPRGWRPRRSTLNTLLFCRASAGTSPLATVFRRWYQSPAACRPEPALAGLLDQWIHPKIPHRIYETDHSDTATPSLYPRRIH